MWKNRKWKCIGILLVIIVSILSHKIVNASGGEDMEGSQLEKFECISEKENVKDSELFKDFEEMEYALFLETNVGYGVTSNYYRYGIYGDFTKKVKDGDMIYFKLCEKLLGVDLSLDTHKEWAENSRLHIQNLSSDLQWVIARTYTSMRTGFYKDVVLYDDVIVETVEGYINNPAPLFILIKTNQETYNLAGSELRNKIEGLVNEIWGYSYIWLVERVVCMDEYGKLLVVSEPNNQTIGIYDMEDLSKKNCININGIDEDYGIEVSQIVGDLERGWIVFSNGNVTYRMSYPDGELKKIGEFMYSTTYSPDEKYLAYCTGNIELNDMWMELSDEKQVKINDLYAEWDKIAPGWYVEELETGKKTYIPIETWEQDDRPLYGGRCIWLQKDKLLQILNS